MGDDEYKSFFSSTTRRWMLGGLVTTSGVAFAKSELSANPISSADRPVADQTSLAKKAKNGLLNGIEASLAIDGHFQGKFVSGTDDGPALNNLFRSHIGLLRIPASPHTQHQSILDGKDPPDSRNFYSLINTPVLIPSQKSMEGIGGSHSGFIAKDTPSSGILNGAMFYLNVNPDNGKPIMPLPNLPSTSIRALKFNAYHAGLAGHTLRAFVYAGSPVIEDCQFVGFAEIARAIDSYSDAPLFRRIAAFEAPLRRGDIWLLNHALGMGDGGVIEQCHFLGASDSAAGGSYVRAQAVRLNNRSGWSLRQILNGDIYISKCRATEMTGLYMERGRTTIEDSRGTHVSNSVYFMRGTGPQAITPLVLRSGGVPRASSAGTNSAAIDNIGFIYDPLGQQVPWTKPPAPGNFDKNTHHNFEVSGSGHYSFSNLFREFNPGDYNRAVLSGVTCGHSTFDDYAHIASARSQYVDGQWLFEARLPGLADADISVAGIDNYLPFFLSDNKFRYYAQFLYDSQRMAGVAAAREIQVAAKSSSSFGSGGAIILKASVNGPCILRLYRANAETAIGHFNSEVDIPLLAGSALFDMGITLNERPWKSRFASPPEPIALIDSGFSIAPGVPQSTKSPSYGSVVCSSSAATAPNSGSWRAGDRVETRTPQIHLNGNLKALLTGWRRVTDGSRHEQGIDWIPNLDVIEIAG